MSTLQRTMRNKKTHLQEFGGTSQLTDIPRRHLDVDIVAEVGDEAEGVGAAGEVGQLHPLPVRRQGAAGQRPEEVGAHVQREAVQPEVAAVDDDDDVGQLGRVAELSEVHLRRQSRVSRSFGGGIRMVGSGAGRISRNPKTGLWHWNPCVVSFIVDPVETVGCCKLNESCCNCWSLSVTSVAGM